MRAGAKTPWVLAAVSALLGLYIAVFERKHETTDEARAARELLFPGLTRSEVISVEIDRGAKGRVMLTRAGAAGAEDEWRVGPADESAARSAVEELLDGIDGTEVDRVATASAAEAGLAPPALHLVLTAPAKHFALDAGSLDASGRGVFVRREGDSRILVVGANLRRLIDRDAGAFRPRRVFSATDVQQATALAFHSDAGSPQTLRRRARVWLDEQGTFATRAAVDEALRMLTALQPTGFPSGAPADGGATTAAPRRTVSLDGGSSGGRRLEVWTDSCPTNAGARGELARLTRTEGKSVPAPPEWICVDENDVERLWRQLEAANRRDPHLLVVDPAGVDQVDLSEGERRLRLRADGNGDWRFAEPAVSYDADTKAVGEWLAKLAATTTTSAEARADGRAAGPSVPRKLRAQAGDAAPAELAIAPPRGDRSRVERAGEATPLFVGAEAFGLLEPEPLRFRSREVMALPQFDVRALQIRGRRAPISLHRESGADWGRDGGGGGGALNTSAVDHLLSLLSNLRAEAFVIPQPRSFQAETSLDVEVRSGDAPAQHHRLELRGECRGRVDDTPVFTLAAKPCDDLERTIAAIH